MTNIHKLKQSSKNLTQHLKTLYPKRDEAVKNLERISRRIAQLEESKKNCLVQVKQRKKEKS